MQETPAPVKRELPPSQRPEYRREYMKRYLSDPEKRAKTAARQAAWQANNPNARAKHHLWSTYRLTLEDYQQLLNRCDSKCQICNKEVQHIQAEVSVSKKACVDHCHSTGKVRGILCHSCNKQLRFYEDHKDAIKKYLEG